MNKSQDDIRDLIIEAARGRAPFEGWNMRMLEGAAQDAGQSGRMADALFPGGVPAALVHHADLADRQMLARLNAEIADVSSLRVRDRIRTAILARFEVLLPYREAERKALSYWSMPTRTVTGAKILWRTADKIWIWAGDDSKDYNHYTKRTLLSGVIGSAFLVWLEDNSKNQNETAAFVSRRIENVLKLGQAIGGFRKAKSA